MSYRKKYREGQYSEINSQRALLDSLMGVNRNNDSENNKIKDYKDDRICKNYLLGLCPHDLFGNTKLDLGPCPKFHTQEFKKSFESNLVDLEYYENTLEKEILSYLNDVDKKIKRSRARLESDDLKGIQIESNPFVLKLNADIMKLIDEIETAGDNDEIDKAMELMNTVNGLHEERKNLLSKLADEKATTTKQGIDINDKLRVCDICGAFLSIYDNDQRLIDHFIGKLHLGYQTMRYKLEEINMRRAERKKRVNVNHNNSISTNSNNNGHTNHFPNSSNLKYDQSNLNPQTELQEQSIHSKKDMTTSSLPLTSHSLSMISSRKIGSLDSEQNLLKSRKIRKHDTIEEDGEINSNQDERKRSNSRDSSRSGSIGSLGSYSSAIIRRRKRREELETITNEKEFRKDRYKRDKSYSPSRERNEKSKKKSKRRRDESSDKDDLLYFNHESDRNYRSKDYDGRKRREESK